jgi:DNA polymerase III delta' subunit
MALKSFIGQKKITDKLRRALSLGTLSHSYLFSGPEGIGKKTLARAFASELVCTSPDTNGPCGNCNACKMFRAGIPTDYFWLQPEGDHVSVDDIRNIQSDIVIRPMYSERKIYVITGGDTMTVQAQNCLLKTLEEPPGYAVIILLAEKSESLLPTVMSRVIHYELEKYTKEDLSAILAQNDIRISPEFLDPFKRAVVKDLLFQIKDVKYFEFGGYEKADRKSFVIMPEDFSEESAEIDRMFSLVSIIPVTGADSLTHRDYLGAVMNLGIKREFFGDLLLNPKGCMIVGKKSVTETIHQSLTKVGKYSVNTRPESFDNIIVPEESFKELTESVSSLRLDCIVGAAFHLSRSEAAELIKSGRAFVNYKETTDISKKIPENTLLSLRGYGKAEISEIMGETRKGRLRVKIKIYQ